MPRLSLQVTWLRKAATVEQMLGGSTFSLLSYFAMEAEETYRFLRLKKSVLRVLLTPYLPLSIPCLMFLAQCCIQMQVLPVIRHAYPLFEKLILLQLEYQSKVRGMILELPKVYRRPLCVSAKIVLGHYLLYRYSKRVVYPS